MSNRKKKERMPWILPLPPVSSLVLDESPFHIVQPEINILPSVSSLVLDESPAPIVGPNTQELQNIKNMILSLQLDLQEERCKRECLEEKMRKFEGNLTQKSQELPERKKSRESSERK